MDQNLKLTEVNCDLFNQPFFQFAQLKKYAPERIEPMKVAYKQAWQQWRATIQAVADELGEPFAAPHIERWCNGWQVRAHFFAYFKYAQNQNSAAILSVLLNRRRLTVSLDWHCYRADRSQISLPQYNQWLDTLDEKSLSSFDVWHSSEDEYDDYRTLSQMGKNNLALRGDDDFFCIGRHLERDKISQHDVVSWIVEIIRQLQPLYEACHR